MNLAMCMRFALGQLSFANVIALVKGGHMLSVPITVRDIKNALVPKVYLA
jgi:hypothetical protein